MNIIGTMSIERVTLLYCDMWLCDWKHLVLRILKLQNNYLIYKNNLKNYKVFILAFKKMNVLANYENWTILVFRQLNQIHGRNLIQGKHNINTTNWFRNWTIKLYGIRCVILRCHTFDKYVPLIFSIFFSYFCTLILCFIIYPLIACYSSNPITVPKTFFSSSDAGDDDL